MLTKPHDGNDCDSDVGVGLVLALVLALVLVLVLLSLALGRRVKVQWIQNVHICMSCINSLKCQLQTEPQQNTKNTTTTTSRKNLYKIQIMQDFIHIYIHRLFGHKNNMKMFGLTKVCNGNVRNVKMCGNYTFEGVQLCGWGGWGLRGNGAYALLECLKECLIFTTLAAVDLMKLRAAKDSRASAAEDNKTANGKWENGKMALIMLCCAVSSGAINNL